MKFDPVHFRSILFAAALNSALQSILWVVLTVAAILAFRCVLPTPQYETDSFVATTLVKFYFEGANCKVNSSPPAYPDVEEVSLMSPDVVFSWMVAYLVVSLVHLTVSVGLFKHRADTHELLRLMLQGWCILTFVTLVMDAFFSASFLRDYLKLKEHLKDHKEDIEDISSIPAAMFVAAARGFALWLMNFVELLYFILWLKSQRGHTKMDGNRQPTVSISTSYDNFNFSNSMESLVPRQLRDWDAKCYKSTSDARFYPPSKQEQQSSDSLFQFEGVTAFNEEVRPPVPPKPRNLLGKRNSGRRESSCCGCNQWTENRRSGEGSVRPPWLGKPYHGHGCSQLRAELEEKLETIRLKQEAANAKSLPPDFSHDMKNFKQGRGVARPDKKGKLRAPPPPPPPLPPAALKCSDANFY